MKTAVLPNTTIALLNDFVTEQRGRTIGWLRTKMNLSHSDAEDVFQESFITLYENLADGTLSELPRSLAAYLNEVCRRKALELIRDHERRQGKGTVEADNDREDMTADEASLQAESEMDEAMPDFRDDMLDEVITMNSVQEEAERVDRQEAAVREVVRNLPDPCNKLLWGFYFENYSMRDMAAMYGYRSADSVKTLKNRCMNRFEARMREVYKHLFND